MEDAARALRRTLGIPEVGSAEAHSTVLDGWRVAARGARNIGLIRLFDVDHEPGPDHRDWQPRLVAQELLDHMGHERISTHVASSFAQMDAAGHHLDDPALVLAIASREGAHEPRSPSMRGCGARTTRGARTTLGVGGTGWISLAQCAAVSAPRATRPTTNTPSCAGLTATKRWRRSSPQTSTGMISWFSTRRTSCGQSASSERRCVSCSAMTRGWRRGARTCAARGPSSRSAVEGAAASCMRCGVPGTSAMTRASSRTPRWSGPTASSAPA